MPDTITLTGVVGTIPRNLVTSDGLAVTSFRLASGQRRFDRASNAWVDGETNWYTITTFRQLATNVSRSIVKGEHVLVTGRVRVRDWAAGERSGTTVDIEADAVGHDLRWGTSSFTRVMTAGAAPADGDPGAEQHANDAAARASGDWAAPGVSFSSLDAGADGGGAFDGPGSLAPVAAGFGDDEGDDDDEIAVVRAGSDTPF